MNTIPPPSPYRFIIVYFNNGVNANRPWWVGVKEGRAIIATFGNFRSAPLAIASALDLCRKLNAPLIVPAWLTGLAKAIKTVLAAPPDGSRAARLRLRVSSAELSPNDPNDFDRLLNLVRLGLYPISRMDEATLAAIEEEWIGLDFCRQPFLY